MIFDLLQKAWEAESDAGAEADVCIVGAGAAGIVLAVELVRKGKRVLLLEGGGAEIEEAAQETYQSEVSGRPYSGVHMGRFRAKGGSTTKWGGQILELDEGDFAERAWIPGSGWPFSKVTLIPHYERSLEMVGLRDVTRKDDAVWREIGEEPPRFESLQPYFSRWCPEPNFALLHGQILDEQGGLSVWLHANAVGLELEGDTVRGVRCRTLTGVEAVFRAQEYVFCLGGIESSRFFLQPREGGAPWNRSGLVGKHFQDHIECNAATVEPVDAGRFHAVFDNVFSRGYKYHPRLRLDPCLQAEQKTLNCAATMYFLSDGDAALNQIRTTAKHLLRGRWRQVSAGDLRHTAQNFPMVARQMWRYGVQHRAYNPADARIMLRVQCEQEPESRSSITLAESRDALGLLRTRVNWQVSERELGSIRRYVEVAQKALAPVARVMPDEQLISGDPGFAALCDDSYHHMGGMRMGGSAEKSVVDPNLLLHGVRNLYVCSSAVFPTSGFSNPTHTLLALTMRLAEHLS